MSIFRVPRLNYGVPDEFRKVFSHLYLDILWFGVLNGSSISFITVYFARIGGSGSQIGFLGALPAIVAILFTVPAGIWLQKGDANRKVVIASFVHRVFYLVWIPIPFLFTNSLEIQLFLIVTFLMSIPGTILQVGFNGLFADTVPTEWRGHVAGVRNALLAVATIISSLICGQLLIKIPFPVNYQVVFAMGFTGAMLSSIHLLLLIRQYGKISINRPINNESSNIRDDKFTSRRIKPAFIDWPKINNNPHFYKIMMLLFFFHLAQYMCVPVFPIFWVKYLKLTDNLISLGNGVLFVTVFLGSLQISKLSKKHGNKKIVGIGGLMMALYPGIMAFSKGPFLYFVASMVAGFAWSLAGGLLVNYLLEKIPEKNRAPYLSLYNLFFFSAVLLGSLFGPVFGDLIGITNALILFAVLRLAAGAAILWKG